MDKQKRPRRILTAELVSQIRDEVRSGASPTEVAARLGLNTRSVQNATYGHTWDHLSGALDPPAQASWLEGERSPLAKLTEAEVLEIRRLRDEYEYSYAGLADQFDISVSTIAAICQGKVWKHLL